MNDDQLELANAYLDGEATAAERVLVESDAELLAEVGRLRVVRSAIGDIGPPAVEVRDSAIAAALAEFSGRRTSGPPPAAAASPTAATIDRRQRIRRMQTLSAAAAAILIVGAGIVIAQRDTGDRSPDAAVQQDSKPVARAPTATEATDATTAAADEPATTTDAPMMAAPPPTVLAAPADAVADPADESAEIEAQSDSGEVSPDPPAATPIVGGGAGQVVVRDDTDLLELAESMKVVPIDAERAEEACADGTLKADALFEAEDGTQQSIVVVTIGQDDSRELAALSLDACQIVLRVDDAAG